MPTELRRRTEAWRNRPAKAATSTKTMFRSMTTTSFRMPETLFYVTGTLFHWAVLSDNTFQARSYCAVFVVV